MTLPQDPFILLSYINTQLRDNYSSLEELCHDLDVDRNEIESTLSQVDYIYNEESNQFK